MSLTEISHIKKGYIINLNFQHKSHETTGKPKSLTVHEHCNNCAMFYINWNKVTCINLKEYLILQNTPQNTYFTTP